MDYPKATEARIDEILELINKMPADKEGRLKLAQYMVDTHLTVNEAEGYLENEEKKCESDSDEEGPPAPPTSLVLGSVLLEPDCKLGGGVLTVS